MFGKFGSGCVSLLALLLLAGCIAAPQTTALLSLSKKDEFSTPVMLGNVPFYAQDLYQCGPAALAMMLDASGLSLTPESLVPLVYLPQRKGSFQAELIAATRSKGRLAYEISPSMTALFTEVAAGQPVLVLQNLGLSWYQRWHYAVVTGFDMQRRKVIMNSGLVEHYEETFATFEHTWARSKHWAMLVLPPGSMPVTADAVHYFNAVVALEKTNPASLVELAYNSGLQRWPTDRTLLMGFANLHYTEKDLTGAAVLYQRVINNHPAYAPAYNNLAQVQFELGDRVEAAANAGKAVELGGDHVATFIATMQTITAAE